MQVTLPKEPSLNLLSKLINTKLTILIYILYLKANVEEYESDPLSNSFAYHITGTEGQALIDLWHLIRQYRVTASKFKVIIKVKD